MALKIVTGGTTGAADGTLVSSGNPLVITALNTAIDAHIRCDDGYWSSDQSFDVPAELKVSFDGGSTYYGNADEPITAPEIYAVNVPIKVKQTTAASSTSGSFTTNGTYTAIAALSTPTLTATVVSSSQIDLSWTNVSNEDASPGYTIERSPDGSSWSSLTTKAANVTTHSDTGLTAGTRYYYRVKAEGSGRYSDSGWGTDDDTTTSNVHRQDTFADTDGVAIGSHSPTGGAGTWSTAYNPTSTSDLRVKSNRVLATVTSGGPIDTTVESWLSGSSNNDCAGEVDGYVNTVNGSSIMVACRNTGASHAARNQYRAVLNTDGTLTLAKVVAGSYTSLGTYAAGTLTAGNTYTVRVEAIGTAIKAYINGVQRISVTDSAVTTGGGLGLFVSNLGANLYSSSAVGWSADAVRLYNT